MTRAEHLAWCKQRAHEYLEKGDVTNAVASMMSDLKKHPETQTQVGGILDQIGMQAAMNQDRAAAKRYIDGFN